MTPDAESKREHLALCARCYPQFEFERTSLDTIASARREHSHRGRVRERVLAALRAEDFASV